MKKIIIFITLALFICFNLNAQQWVHQVSGNTNGLSGIDFFDDYHGVAVGSGGTILKTSDGGNNWVQKISQTTDHLADVVYIDAQNVIAVGDNNVIRKSSDGGETWAVISSPLSTSPSIKFRSVWFYDHNLGFIVGGISSSAGYVLKTIDGGVTWADISPSPNTGQVFYGIFFTSPTNGFISDFNGRIYKNTSTGQQPGNWNLEINTGAYINTLFFTSSTKGFAVGINGKMYEYNGSWNTTPTPLSGVTSSDALFDIEFLGNTGYIVGGNTTGNTGKVLKSTDGGANWVVDAFQTTNRLIRLSISSSHVAYACGLEGLNSPNGHGVIMKSEDLCCDDLYDQFNLSTIDCQVNGSSVTFTAPPGTISTDVITWDFGDGSTGTGTTISHTYNSPGSYLVTLWIERVLPNGEICKIKLCKLVEIVVNCLDCESFLSQENITLAVDMSTWSSTGTISFYPFPVFSPYNVRVLWDFDCDGIVDEITSGNNPATSNYPCGQNSVCYTVECLLSQQVACYSKSGSTTFDIPCAGNQSNCPNLISNGAFELGDDGSFTTFASQDCNGGCAAGAYCVAPSFQNKCNGWPAGGDHTSGTGNFLMIDGMTSGSGPFTVWGTTGIPVTPGTTYKFSFWAKSVYPTNQQVLNLDMVIDGNGTSNPVPLTFNKTISQQPIQWAKYEASLWTCPTGTTTVDLSIRQLTAGAFTDFGIDDISFTCIDCYDFMTDVMDHGIMGSGLGVNTYQFCLSPNISPTDIIQWDMDCDGSSNVPSSISGNCATFTITANNTQICAEVFRIQPNGDTCRVTVNACLPDFIETGDCTCDTFQDDVNDGFTSVEGPALTFTFTPVSLIDNCDAIFWDWGDGSNSSSLGTASITHTYTSAMAHFVCMIVTRTLPDGTMCPIAEYCEDVTTPAPIINDPEFSLLVQPNPTSGDAFVTFTTDISAAGYQLRITNVQGQVIQFMPVTNNQLQLNMQQLPAGLYFLSLHNQQGKMLYAPSKLVKQ